MQLDQSQEEADKLAAAPARPSRWQLFHAARAGIEQAAHRAIPPAAKPSRWQLFHAAKAGVEQAKHLQSNSNTQEVTK